MQEHKIDKDSFKEDNANEVDEMKDSDELCRVTKKTRKQEHVNSKITRLSVNRELAKIA